MNIDVASVSALVSIQEISKRLLNGEIQMKFGKVQWELNPGAQRAPVVVGYQYILYRV